MCKKIRVLFYFFANYNWKKRYLTLLEDVSLFSKYKNDFLYKLY